MDALTILILTLFYAMPLVLNLWTSLKLDEEIRRVETRMLNVTQSIMDWVRAEKKIILQEIEQRKNETQEEDRSFVAQRVANEQTNAAYELFLRRQQQEPISSSGMSDSDDSEYVQE